MAGLSWLLRRLLRIHNTFTMPGRSGVFVMIPTRGSVYAKTIKAEGLDFGLKYRIVQ